MAQVQVETCAGCKGTGVASEKYVAMRITRGGNVGAPCGAMVQRERCTRCRHLRGVILLAREMVP